MGALALAAGALETRADDDLAALAGQAVSTDETVALAARMKLRAGGPAGLEALQTRFAKEIVAQRVGASASEGWKRISAALDQMSGQYDDYASGLYWYTDLSQAKLAAKASGRPILTLRLLGRLDRNLSCANSRFFRTTLYPNAEVNRLLKEKFVLHWESVRPVPVVTIDFGDGRKLQRTITGNSIHYVIDARGRILDALPGLYSGRVFVEELNRAADQMAAFGSGDDASVTAARAATEQRLLAAWARDVEGAGLGKVAQPVARETLIGLMNDRAWSAIAALESRNRRQVDDAALRLVSSKFPDAATASRLTMSKMAVESPLVKAVARLDENISQDTVRNNFELRTRILGYLDSPEARGRSLAQVNDWVYAQVFLTPRSDPWLGLAPQDAFAALDDNGVMANPDASVIGEVRK